jgi:DNA repair protein RadC
MADTGNKGHRQRLRDRFARGEESCRTEESLLEMLLTFAVARKDTGLLAQELINAFGGLPQVLSASYSDLKKIKGLGESSITLLKVVNSIQSGTESFEKNPPAAKTPNASQRMLLEDPNVRKTPMHESEDSHIVIIDDHKEAEARSTQPEQKGEISKLEGPAASEIASPPQTQPSPQKPSTKRADQRKFQVSNGYLLEFDQLAHVLHFLLEHRHAKKINRKFLQEDTGLADRQVESLVSIGSAMGLIKPRLQVLTPVGLLIAEHDIFLEKKGSLEWCHYVGAGSYRNLIWFEIFNRILREASPMTQEEWSGRIQSNLAGKYSKRTISKGLHEEVRFVIDAYMKRNFSKLGILHQLSDDRFYRRRYTGFAPLVFVAMIYDFCATNEAHLSQVAEMATTPGSPAMVFGLDAASFRQQIEGTHDRGWLRYETTHNLDQIRLKPGYCALEFLTAHFEDREPRASSNQSPEGPLV